MQNEKKRLVLFLEYAVIFICLLAVFFFMRPGIDEVVFSRNSESDFVSILNHSVFYGNGRVLGNILGITLSHYYEWVPFAIAISITIATILSNNLLFNNSKFIPFLLAILYTYPSASAFNEVHLLSSSFVNFFVPITIVLISLYLCKCLNRDLRVSTKIILNILLFLSTIAACLFSENTSIVIFITALTINFFSFFIEKKLKSHQINFLISSVLGTVVIFFLSYVLGTTHNLDAYRNPPTDISSLLSIFRENIFSLSLFLTSSVLLITIVSLALILTILNQKTNTKIKVILITFLSAFTIFCIFVSITPRTSLTVKLGLIAMIIYFFVILYVLFKIEDKTQRLKALLLYVVLLSAIVPMLIVQPYGFRTILTTYFVMLFVAAFLFSNLPQTKIASSKKWSRIKTIFTTLVCIIFVFKSGSLAIQMLYNYNFYVVRSNYIIQEIKSENDRIVVPNLPFAATTYENEYPDFVKWSADEYFDKIEQAELSDCPNSEKYQQVLSNSFLESIKFAFDNLEFRSSTIIDDSIKR